MKTKLAVLLVFLAVMGGSAFGQNAANGNISASSTNCTSVPLSCVWEQPLPPNANISTVAITGTFSETLLVELSNNSGQTFSTSATLSAVGTTTYNTNGFTDIRVRCSAYVSGTAVVTISTGLNTGLQGPPGPAGSGGGSTPVASLPAVCTPGVTGLVTLTVPGTTGLGIYYCNAPNTWTNAGLSGSATIRLSDFGVVSDAKMQTSCTWTAAANPVVVTCAATDIPFAASDTGHACDGTFAGTTTVGVFTFTSATSGTCNGGTGAVGSPVGNGRFVVYTDNGTNALAAWNTLMAFPRCGTLLLPNGVWGNSQALVHTTPGCSVGPAPSESGGLSVRPNAGSSYTSTMFQPTNFNFANCLAGGGCMFSDSFPSGQVNLEDFNITGAGLSMAGLPCGSGSNFEFSAAVNIRIRNVGLNYGFNNCSNGFNQLSLQAGAQGAVIYGFTQFDTFGSPGQVQNAAQNVLFEDYCCGQLQETGTASAVSVNGFWGQFASGTNPAIGMTGASKFTSIGDSICSNGSQTSLCIDNTGAMLNMIDDVVIATGGATFGLYNRTGVGVIRLRDTVMSGGSTATISGDAGAGTIIDDGNNTLGNSNPFSGNWKVNGPPVMVGIGTGTCTSSTTLFLFGSGQITGRTCTVAAESLTPNQNVATRNGVLHNLRCSSTAAGVNSSSGLVTVRDNGANTALTATFGTTKLAINSPTQSVNTAIGDVITFSITTQVAETLAGVACQVQVD